ncbi:MAG: hypothetical protein L3J33_11565 [Rhodobacteraceae bacterium]|nr:hypothetical protein [Paracoccaceae bacterium]
MSLKAIILICSVIAFIVLNSKFMRDDPEYRKQSEKQKMFGDPLGIKRFKRQPRKMSILTAVLVGPVLLYTLYATFITG